VYIGELKTRVAIAAILHDTVEDTEVTYTQISSWFGQETMIDVFYLSDPVPKEKGNRAARRALSNELIGQAPSCIQLIKLCDIEHNVSSIAQHDPKFAPRYIEEKTAQVLSMSAWWEEDYSLVTTSVHALLNIKDDQSDTIATPEV
jgi:(p)ppGpp synthase/HD superfamily hydrolase